MKESIFAFIWAAICAWVSVWLLMKCGFLENIFSGLLSFVHSHGWSMRKILFWVLFFLYWLTGINKIFGHWILIAIGVISFLFVGFVIIYVGYNFLRLMAGSL